MVLKAIWKQREVMKWYNFFKITIARSETGLFISKDILQESGNDFIDFDNFATGKTCKFLMVEFIQSWKLCTSGNYFFLSM